MMEELPTPMAKMPELPADATMDDWVVATLKTIYDPEIPVDIYELGLIYGYTVDPERDNFVDIQMTLTSPSCPVAGSLPGDVERRIRSIEGVSDVKVEVTWDPPWGPEKMSEAAKLTLGMDLDM